MKIRHTISTAIESIFDNKSRSFLTILGILIGIAGIIAMMSIGKGATNLILAEIDHLGATTVIVLPGGGGFEEALVDSFFADSLTERDLQALKKPINVPNMSDIMPVVIVPGDVRFDDRTYRRAVIIGAEAKYFEDTFNIVLEQGNGFSDVDVRNNSRVAVIGSRVKEELFGDVSALGERVTVRDTRFLVVGVYPQIGQRGIFNVDDLVLIPYTTAQINVLGHDNFDRFFVRADDTANVNRMARDIEMTLRETRDITTGEDDDFTVMTQQGLLDQIGTIMNILTAFLVFVVAISLVVGGIGIMNIMLVSVTERTKEIGLRKALGATGGDILRQFLWEAVVLTVIGGFLGILVGVSIALIASFVLSSYVLSGWDFVFPLQATILAVCVSAVVGLIFGIYPAYKASKKSPIEALRYE